MVIKAQTWWVLTEIRLNGSVVFKVPPPYSPESDIRHLRRKAGWTMEMYLWLE